MTGGNFDREAAERIIRRAIELDDAVAPAPPDRIAEQALVEAAEELGIDVAAVRRAAAEERLGVTPERPTLRDRLVGPGRVVAAWPFECPPGAALDRIDAWMRRSGGFRRVSLNADGAEYRRRNDPIAAATRATRKVTGREQLSPSIERLSVLVEPLHGGATLVAFSVDKSVAQSLATASAATVAGGGSLISILAATAFTDVEALALGVPVAVAAGWGIGAVRKLALAETELNLTGVVRAIANEGAQPESPGVAAANAVRNFSNLLNRGVSARRGSASRGGGAAAGR